MPNLLDLGIQLILFLQGLGGWVVGAGLVWGYLKLVGPLPACFKHQTTGQQLLVAFGGSLLLALLGVLAKINLGAWTIPAA